MNVSLGSSEFLEETLVFPFLLFSFISLHWSLSKAFLSLPALPWNCTFKWVYLSFSALPFASLLLSAIYKASSDNHFAFSLSFFLEMVLIAASYQFSSVQFSCSVVSDSLRPHELQHARLPCPSPTPGVHPNSHPSSWWCHPAISSSVVPFSSCPQSLPASESFPMSQLFHEVAKVLEFQL